MSNSETMTNEELAEAIKVTNGYRAAACFDTAKKFQDHLDDLLAEQHRRAIARTDA